MAKAVLHAYLKTIDGEEVMEYTKGDFEEVIKGLKIRTVRKSDRVLYFVKDNNHINRIKFFKDDYFEVIK